jgi:hypothetical protein
MSWLKILDLMHVGVAIPRANELTIVAPKDSVPDGISQRFRNDALVFDGEIGDASTRIKFIRANNGVCRADVDTSLTASAVVARCLGGGGKREIGQQFAEKMV